MNIIEAYEKLRPILDSNLTNFSFDKDLREALSSVLEYAMDSYVSDAEDMGREIVKNADIIEEKSYKRGWKEAVDKANDFICCRFKDEPNMDVYTQRRHPV